MTVTAVDKNPAELSMCITSEFDAPVERVWQLWADPRLLERWWGPPTYPATFADYELTPGEFISYYMTGPEGDQHYGWWKVLAVEGPRRLEVEDGFANDDGTPNPDMPSGYMRVDIAATSGGTRMDVTSIFPSKADMEKVLEMGQEEGMKEAMGQIDGILAELATHAG